MDKYKRDGPQAVSLKIAHPFRGSAGFLNIVELQDWKEQGYGDMSLLSLPVHVFSPTLPS